MEKSLDKTKNKNVTFIIGNGFDLNLGLKTSYYDFVKWYKRQDSDGQGPVQLLKDNINEEEIKWGDLELKLGEYTNLFNSHDEFYKAFCDIGEKLIQYLSNEEIKYSQIFDIGKKAMAHNFLDNVLVFLSKNKLLGEGKVIINFVTFNYTLVIGDIIETIKRDDDLKTILKNKNIEINLPYYCHGSLQSGKICFGVDNYSQVQNQKIFISHERYIDQMVKPIRNDFFNSKYKQNSELAIKKSDVLVIYGCSLGKTDIYWVNVIKTFLGAVQHSMFSRVEWDYDSLMNINKKIFYYSHQKRPESTFDADGIEFEDKIRSNISFADDSRINITYDNIFAEVKNSIDKYNSKYKR